MSSSMRWRSGLIGRVSGWSALAGTVRAPLAEGCPPMLKDRPKPFQSLQRGQRTKGLAAAPSREAGSCIDGERTSLTNRRDRRLCAHLSRRLGAPNFLKADQARPAQADPEGRLVL